MCFKVRCTASGAVLQRSVICVFFLSFRQATLNEVHTLLTSILQRNELWKNLSKHVPTVHTKDCMNHILCFHKTFSTIYCWSACISLSFLQLKFANKKAFSANRLIRSPGDLEPRVSGVAGYTTPVWYKGKVSHLLSLF